MRYHSRKRERERQRERDRERETEREREIMMKRFNSSHMNELCKGFCSRGFVSAATVAAKFNVTSKKLPNVYKSCKKMISLEKLKILTLLQKLPEKMGRFGQINCCPKALKSCPKSNKSPDLVTLHLSELIDETRSKSVEMSPSLWRLIFRKYCQ